MWRFVDIFHHRMLSLLYRAWANAEPVVNADRRDDDRFTRYVASLIGLGLDSLTERDALPDHGRFHYAGHFARQARSPEGLIGAIEDYFSVNAVLQQFVGEWLSIPEASHWRLGERRRDGGLGLGTTIGESVWGCQHKFRIVIGPVDFDTLQSFLPGSETSNRLVAIVRNYCGDEFDWDVQLILKKEEVPALELGKQGLLGRTSWCNQDERTADVVDTRLHPVSRVWRNKQAA
ncbi:MAG: type VI secretion system baseplate subunit TssG, partial [Gammaproteobacteria bacterium]|nr:type VI secretion system baseplate subunit TssG [Gammaproteobacteria bacterium]